jgi:8-oxo-dGTP pyrophosphatase MutT (NUDIX family)
MANKIKRPTCGIVIKSGGKYLICRSTRSWDKEGREVWGFPKGRQDDESFEDTAMREVMEETGLHFYKHNLNYLCSYQHKGRIIIWFFVDCDEFDCEPINVDDLECDTIVDGKDYPEIDAYKLVNKKDLTKYIFNHMMNVVKELP